MDIFQQLIWDLGEITKLPLHVDENRSCRLLIEGKLPVHLEMDSTGDYLIVAAMLPEIAPGRFREEILKAALKTNASYHSFGVLSYVEKKNILVLHKLLLASQCSAQQLIDFLIPFIEYAESWQKAIESGIPPSSSEPLPSDSPPPFSLR